MSSHEKKHDLSSLRIDREGAKARNPRPARWKTWGGAAFLFFLLLAAGFFLLRTAFDAPLAVELTTVSLISPGQANAVLTANGYVVAEKKASIASKGTGRLVYLGVEEGDRVKEGQIIARLEDQDVLATLNRTKADLEFARADSFDAAQTFTREKAMHESGLTSKAVLDAAEARLLRTIASIKSAAAAVEEAGVALENTRIRAPFDGTVLTKDADVGEVVAPFASSANSRAAVVTMADMSSLEVEADVSESNITRVSAGQSCEIVLDAYPSVRYDGYVHKIVPTADRAKATVLTKVRFRERDERVLPEMSAKVSFLSSPAGELEDSADPILTVLVSAVVERDGESVVFLIEGTDATRRKVRTGRQLGDRLEILEGVASGDRVVISPPAELSDGMNVAVK